MNIIATGRIERITNSIRALLDFSRSGQSPDRQAVASGGSRRPCHHGRRIMTGGVAVLFLVLLVGTASRSGPRQAHPPNRKVLSSRANWIAPSLVEAGLSLPEVVVFDLDNTIWTPELFEFRTLPKVRRSLHAHTASGACTHTPSRPHMCRWTSPSTSSTLRTWHCTNWRSASCGPARAWRWRRGRTVPRGRRSCSPTSSWRRATGPRPPSAWATWCLAHRSSLAPK